MFRNDFYEISCYKKGIIIYLRWFSSSANMSEIDFIEHIKKLNDIIGAMNSSILFIDTIDFNFPLKKPLIKQISDLIQLGNLRWIGYAIGRNKHIRNIFKRINHDNISLVKYSNRNELQQTYNLIVT
jgi:hypothetical protein